MAEEEIQEFLRTVNVSTLCLKNVPSLTGYNFNTHPLMFIIFGKCHQQTFKNNRLQNNFLNYLVLLALFCSEVK